MRTKKDCQILAEQAIGDYASACLPRSQEELAAPLSLLLSLTAHTLMAATTKEYAQKVLTDIAELLNTTKATVTLEQVSPAHEMEQHKTVQ